MFLCPYVCVYVCMYVYVYVCIYVYMYIGSERLKSTKSTGKVLQEAGFINKSLYVLGKVIAGLVRTHGDRNHRG